MGEADSRASSPHSISIPVFAWARGSASDAAGNRLTETEAELDGAGQPTRTIKQRTFAYNALNQVEFIRDELAPPRSVRYEYNLSGDTTAKIIGQLDASGQLVPGSEISRLNFTWDAAGRLRRVTRQVPTTGKYSGSAAGYSGSAGPGTPAGKVASPSVLGEEELVAEFAYDYSGRRVRHDSRFVFLGDGAGGPGDPVPSDTRFYLYDQQSALAEYQLVGDQLDKSIQYVFGSDLLAAERPDEAGNLSTSFFHQDALGSTVNLTGLGGSVQQSYLYDAWGNYRELDVDGQFDSTPDLEPSGLYTWESYLASIQSAFDPSPEPLSPSPASWNRFTYTGHEFDPATGLYYFKARFYDPELGRFASEDPYLGDTTTPPSLDRYLYAYSNPLLFVDLSGYSAYRVREGDSLSEIARKNKVRLGDLISANRTAGVIQDPDQIAPGQEIWVPEVRQAGDVSRYSREDDHSTTFVYERIDDGGTYHFRRHQQFRRPDAALVYDPETSRWNAAPEGPENWTVAANDWDTLPDVNSLDLPSADSRRGLSSSGGSSIMAGFDWDVFRQGVARRSLDLGLNVGTMGGWAEIQAGIESGTVTDRTSAVRAAAVGVFKTITLGGGEAAVDAYAEGQGLGGISAAAAGGVGRTVLPIEEAGIMLDPNRSGWEKVAAGGSTAIKLASIFIPASVLKSKRSPSLTLQLEFVEGMDRTDFIRHANRIQSAINQGRAFSNLPHGISPAARRAMTRSYRAQLVERINTLYRNNPVARENALSRLRASDIDHILDLQLSGLNERQNLISLHSFTNQVLGSQISRQIPLGQKVPITGLKIVGLP